MKPTDGPIHLFAQEGLRALDDALHARMRAAANRCRQALAIHHQRLFRGIAVERAGVWITAANPHRVGNPGRPGSLSNTMVMPGRFIRFLFCGNHHDGRTATARNSGYSRGPWLVFFLIT